MHTHCCTSALYASPPARGAGDAYRSPGRKEHFRHPPPPDLPGVGRSLRGLAMTFRGPDKPPPAPPQAAPGNEREAPSCGRFLVRFASDLRPTPLATKPIGRKSDATCGSRTRPPTSMVPGARRRAGRARRPGGPGPELAAGLAYSQGDLVAGKRTLIARFSHGTAAQQGDRAISRAISPDRVRVPFPHRRRAGRVRPPARRRRVTGLFVP
jgi:hypothetical protein